MRSALLQTYGVLKKLFKILVFGVTAVTDAKCVVKKAVAIPVKTRLPVAGNLQKFITTKNSFAINAERHHACFDLAI